MQKMRSLDFCERKFNFRGWEKRSRAKDQDSSARPCRALQPQRFAPPGLAAEFSPSLTCCEAGAGTRL